MRLRDNYEKSEHLLGYICDISLVRTLSMQFLTWEIQVQSWVLADISILISCIIQVLTVQEGKFPGSGNVLVRINIFIWCVS